MAETYGFFNNDGGDRVYLDDQFTAPFGAIVGKAGIVYGIDGQLEPSYSGMDVSVETGFAFGGALPGWWYRSTLANTKTIAEATSGQKRIDLVVLRFDRNSDARAVTLEVIAGTEAASDPVAPTLTQNEMLFEVVLAEILVEDSAITSLTDKREFVDIGGNNGSIRNIVVGTGVVLGSPIKLDTNGVWQKDQVGTRAYDGDGNGVKFGVVSGFTGLDVGYTYYFQSDASLGLGVTNYNAGEAVSATEIDFRVDGDETPFAYLENMIKFYAIPGGSGKVRLKVEIPLTATGALIRRSTSAYDGSGITWGTLVEDVTDDSNYKNAYDFLEDSGLTNKVVYYYKAFPYVSGLYNDTDGDNEWYMRAGLILHEYIPSNISGNSVPDSVGSRNMTATNISQGAEGGIIGDSFDGVDGYLRFSSNLDFVEITIVTWLDVVASTANGLSGYSGNGVFRASGIDGSNNFETYAGVTMTSNSVSAGWRMLGAYMGVDADTSKIITTIDALVVHNDNVNTEYLSEAYFDTLLARGNSSKHNTSADVIRIFDGILTQNEWDSLLEEGA